MTPVALRFTSRCVFAALGENFTAHTPPLSIPEHHSSPLYRGLIIFWGDLLHVRYLQQAFNNAGVGTGVRLIAGANDWAEKIS